MPVGASAQAPAMPAGASVQWPAAAQVPAVPASAAAQAPTTPVRAESQAIGDGPDPDAPRCPVCGSTMVLRTAKRGARAGKKFWGCSEYPYCRGIINVGQ